MIFLEGTCAGTDCCQLRCAVADERWMTAGKMAKREWDRYFESQQPSLAYSLPYGANNFYHHNLFETVTKHIHRMKLYSCLEYRIHNFPFFSIVFLLFYTVCFIFCSQYYLQTIINIEAPSHKGSGFARIILIFTWHQCCYCWYPHYITFLNFFISSASTFGSMTSIMKPGHEIIMSTIKYVT